MSRLPDPEQEPVPDPPGPAGRVRSTSPGLLVGLGLAGLVVGWSVRLVSNLVGVTPPAIGWLPALTLALVAVIVGSVAWVTHRTLQSRGQRLPSHQAVNRLVLAKSCAITGALVAGGYLGFALSWVGRIDTPIDQDRLVRSLVAGLAGVAIVAGSVLLERACRVSDDEAST